METELLELLSEEDELLTDEVLTDESEELEELELLLVCAETTATLMNVKALTAIRVEIFFIEKVGEKYLNTQHTNM